MTVDTAELEVPPVELELADAEMAEELWVGVKLAGVDVELALVGVEEVAVELPDVADVTDELMLLEAEADVEADVLADELAEVDLWLVCEDERVEAGETAAELVVSLADEE